MSRRTGIAFAALGVITLAVILSVFMLGTNEAKLTILLRCEEGVTGTLSITNITQSPYSAPKTSYDIAAICRAGEAVYDGYRGEPGISISFQGIGNQTAQVTSMYGEDIQADRQQGYYIVLSIMNTPPFIANDRI